MRVSFNQLAERELNEAAQYCERESGALSAAFLAEVEHTCAHTTKYPEAAPAVLGAIRRVSCAVFQYALLYRYDTVRILAVMSLKRRPVYWTGRHPDTGGRR